MKLYLIGGLGADERVFQQLTIEPPIQVIKWIKQIEGESMHDYVQRLAKQIETKEKFGLLGVSFGGEHFMIVDKSAEISKLINEQIKYAG